MSRGSKERVVIAEALAEAREWLNACPPSPAVRELRVRYGVLDRVVGSWSSSPPHAGQLAAMLECALELRATVVRTCGPLRDRSGTLGSAAGPERASVRPALRLVHRRTTRPPPSPDTSQHTTRPPPPRASKPPPSSRGA